jgi:uncharacterized protein YjbI with pentapeptide repeats
MSNFFKKKPAAENPWYVLATLAGEQTGGYDSDLAKKSKSYWNAWASQALTMEEKAAIKSGLGTSILDDAPEWHTVEAKVVTLFKKRLPNATLPDPSQYVNFSDVEFSDDVCFSGFFFSGDANFSCVTFSGDANLSSTIFSGDANFSSAIFSKRANFSFAVFSKQALFVSAEISGYANFARVAFSGKAIFRAAAFSENASFLGAVFSGSANFSLVVFSWVADGDADFRDVKFSGPSSFKETKFHNEALFEDAVFEAPCNLYDTEFINAYPDLEGTLLHSKTNVTADDEHWPPAQIEQSDKIALNSCAHLRQNMSSQGLNEAAHFFFRREMAHKAKLSKFWERPFYAVYRMAEYGNGVWQPIAGILLLWLAGALSLIYWGCLHYMTALGLSFANIFKFFGFQWGYFEDDVIGKLNPYLEFMTAGQTVMGYFLLFLLGLGLRNRFRLK